MGHETFLRFLFALTPFCHQADSAQACLVFFLMTKNMFY